MKRIVAIAALLLTPALYAQTTLMTAADLVGGDGNPIVTGRITMQPTDINGNPLNVNLGSTHGLMVPRSVTCLIAAGAITTEIGGASCTVVSTAVTNPGNFCYKTTITDTVTSWTAPVIQCLQPLGSTYDLDYYVPTGAPTALEVAGPTGPAGPPGTGYITGLTSDSGSPGGITVSGKISTAGTLPLGFTSIICLGDSLTYSQQDGSTTTPCNQLQADILAGFGVTIPEYNYGYPGQTSLNAGVRIGAIPGYATVTGNTIPACSVTGSCTGVAMSFSPSTQSPANTDGIPVHGTYCGVPGNYEYLSSIYQFIPDNAGSSVSCAAGTQWHPTNIPTANSLVAIWLGTNDEGVYNATAQNVALIASYVQTFSGASFLVMPPQTEDYPDQWVNGVYGKQIVNVAQEEAAAWPGNFLDVRTMLIGLYNPSSANPNLAADQAANSNGLTPASNRAAHTPFGTLNGSLATTGCPVLTVSNVNNFPLDNHQTLIIPSTGEQILVLTHTGSTVNTCMRGYNSTSPGTGLAASSGATVNEIDGVHLSGATYALVGNWMYNWVLQNPAPTSPWVFGLPQLEALKSATQFSSSGAYNYLLDNRQYSFSPIDIQDYSCGQGALESMQGVTNSLGCGYEALYSLQQGSQMNALAPLAFQNVVTGTDSSALSVGAGNALTSVNYATLAGDYALALCVTGCDGSTVFAFHGAYHATVPIDAFGMDSFAGGAVSGVQNGGFGAYTGFSDTSGANNGYAFWKAGYSNQTGNRNTAVAPFSLYYNIASDMTGGGFEACEYETTGGTSTCIGSLSGVTSNSANALTTGAGDTFVGYNAGLSSTTQVSNSFALGASAQVSASNQGVLGNSSVTTIYMGGLSAAAMVEAAGYNLVGTTAPFELQGSAGSSGQCFLSAGAGATPTWGSCAAGGAGTVTSVALTGSGTLFSSTAGSAVTSSGSLNVDSQLQTQSANCVVAGPASGSAATPTCRAMVVGDQPVSTYYTLPTSGGATTVNAANAIRAWGFTLPYNVTFSNIYAVSNTADASNLYSMAITNSSGALLCHPTTGTNIPSAGALWTNACSEGTVTLYAGTVYILLLAGQATTGKVTGSGLAGVAVPYYNGAQTGCSSSSGVVSGTCTISLAAAVSATAVPSFTLH